MMNPSKPNPSRRQFIVGGSAITSGLAIGLLLPRTAVQAQALSAAAVASHEIGAWVVIQADDAVIIRVVRSEMGQGTITGLAQLVAEELECDWKKITIDYPTPGESLKRKGVWGSFSTGGSRGIRESHEYVRQGGAAARIMLLQAAAAEWKVSVSELAVEKGVVTHAGS
ncbi:MAG: xanthine dehydrogenase family protein molybdopterin-binding subunit, partial [Betaproteobacteria bacterium]|nr:xanthine dehydrogenase family protein molybdopterin-binding subunit [Betaproteobacteria bacterium]